MIPVLAIGTAWVLIASAIATVPHRLKRAAHTADPGEDHLTPEWIAGIPTDCLGDGPLLRERFDDIVAGDWFNGTLHYTGRTHGGAA
jgi:hypothetical protein